MSQPNALRIQNEFQALLTATAASKKQEMTMTQFFRRGDLVEFVELKADGKCVEQSLGKRTVVAYCAGQALFLDATIDTSGLAGDVAVRNCTIANQQAFNDRLSKENAHPQTQLYDADVAIVSSSVDTPVAGQMQVELAGQFLCFQQGDSVQVACSPSGDVFSGTIIAQNGAQRTLSFSQDLSGETSCKLINTSVTYHQITERLKASTAAEDQDEDFLGSGDCRFTTFRLSNPAIVNSWQVYVDGNRKRPGQVGTRSSLVVGTGNAELTLTSLVLGASGDGVSFEIVNAAGNDVTVTGSFPNYAVQINNDSGAATAAQIAAALNSDPIASKVLQAIYGGDGSGAMVAAASANLAGGGGATGDYSVIEEVAGNSLTGGGYSIVAFNIEPDAKNRIQEPLVESEEVSAVYRK